MTCAFFRRPFIFRFNEYLNFFSLQPHLTKHLQSLILEAAARLGVEALKKMGYEKFEALCRRLGLLSDQRRYAFLNDDPPKRGYPSIFFRAAEEVVPPLSRAIYRLRPNNSRRKETKTASEERKEPEMKPFHERYREERTIPPSIFFQSRGTTPCSTAHS